MSAAKDMSRKLQQSLAEVLIRETTIAQHVCTFPELAFIMIEASVMMVRTTAGTIANTIGDDREAEALIGVTVDSIIEQVRISQPGIVEAVLAERKARAA